MNLYLLSQSERDDYDTFDSCVVCAESEDEAKHIHPWDSKYPDGNNWEDYVWASCPENVTCELIGTAADGVEKGVVIASFNAG